MPWRSVPRGLQGVGKSGGDDSQGSPEEAFGGDIFPEEGEEEAHDQEGMGVLLVFRALRRQAEQEGHHRQEGGDSEEGAALGAESRTESLF